MTDTSGAHNSKWDTLGGHQFEWARNRHRPLLAALREQGTQAIWVEACRYQEEARAIVALARELGFRMVAVCFEAKEQGHPDPLYKGSYHFRNAKADLQQEAGSDTDVWVGANCTGASIIQRIWARGDELDVAYPNQKDFGNGNEVYRDRFVALVHQKTRTAQEEAELSEIEALLNTSTELLKSTWEQALSHGTKVIGICCGGNLKHVEQANNVYSTFKNF